MLCGAVSYGGSCSGIYTEGGTKVVRCGAVSYGGSCDCSGTKGCTKGCAKGDTEAREYVS